jgi:Uma2 family endonuclease
VHHYTFADYLALEEFSNTKHEFLDGDILAMGGGTPTHAELAVTISALLFSQLRGRPCRVFSSDLRVRVPATGLATYPDVTVVCGALETDPDSSVTVTNPSVVVEILSDSTERYDRGVKLRHYQQIASLGAVVLVAQCDRRIDVWERGADGAWAAQTYRDGATERITSVGCALAVDEVYRDPSESFDA